MCYWESNSSNITKFPISFFWKATCLILSPYQLAHLMRFLVRGIVPCFLTGSEKLYCQTQCWICTGAALDTDTQVCTAFLLSATHSCSFLLSFPNRIPGGAWAFSVYLLIWCSVALCVDLCSHPMLILCAKLLSGCYIKGKTLLCLLLFPQRLYNAPGIGGAGWKQGRSAPRDLIAWCVRQRRKAWGRDTHTIIHTYTNIHIYIQTHTCICIHTIIHTHTCMHT